MDYKLIENEFGYLEIENKPTEEFLMEYYAKKYYVESDSKLNQYVADYTPEEILYKKNIAQRKYELLKRNNITWLQSKFKVLDVGCGEGWNLTYFDELGCDITGIEYQSGACEKQNPHVSDRVRSGNVWQIVDDIAEEGNQYDLIILDNVFEHVLYPSKRLEQLKKILSPTGVLIIEVPNDYSVIQKKLKEEKFISREFWFAPPDHLSYFNLKGLNALTSHHGYKMIDLTSDYPISFNLFNPDTNYVDDRTKGRNVHMSRVHIENLLNSISVEKSLDIYASFAEMGLGRNIIGFYQLDQ